MALAFTDIRPANKFFKPMVREQKFDVSEIAIGTFLQAKAYGKPLVLLPATMMGRFQHNTLLCRASHPLTPAELPGKRVGLRAYAQTTGNWVRGFWRTNTASSPTRYTGWCSRTATWPSIKTRRRWNGRPPTRTS